MKKENQKENQPSEGLGDTVAKVTEFLMLDKLAQQLTEVMGKKDCGCDRRRQKLNQMFPYKNKDKNQEE